jgi:DNA polymerase III epsilon subunit-like protein
MTGICAIDTETTSLRADRRAWEVGIVARTPGRPDVEHHWFIDAGDLDLGNADVMSLKIGRFHERHPQYQLSHEAPWSAADAEADALRQIEAITRGAHLVGAVVSFDADVLGQRMRAHGICPSWHHHLIDIEALAVGWLNGRRSRQNEIVDGYPLENDGKKAPGLVRWDSPGPWDVPLPWKSDDLSRLVGVEPASDEDRHTALGDARWALAVYDAITGGA